MRLKSLEERRIAIKALPPAYQEWVKAYLVMWWERK